MTNAQNTSERWVVLAQDGNGNTRVVSGSTTYPTRQAAERSLRRYDRYLPMNGCLYAAPAVA